MPDAETPVIFNIQQTGYYRWEIMPDTGLTVIITG